MTNPALQEVIALLGHPAAGTPAQYLFERVVVGDSLDWRFVTLEVQPERLAAALDGLAAMNFRGCLLAGSLQQPAAELLSAISPAAQFAGGCSLIERTPDGLSGHLTLGRGLLEAVRLHADPAASPTVIIGSGLLARATALELTLAGVPEIIVADPWHDGGDSMVQAIVGIEGGQASLLPTETDETELLIPERAGLVVVAADQQPFPIARDLTGLREDLVVVDTSLAPKASPVLEAAAAARACRVDGLEVATAILAIDFQRLTGIEADTELLRDALDEFLDC
jgi:shikimate 5-dehydrogenase